MTPSQRSKKTDRRVIRTCKAIMNAYDKLICEKDAGKVTVSAIAREANIDRKTFYLHYRSVEDLATRKTGEALERIFGKLVSEGVGKSFPERVHIVLMEANKIFTENVTVYANLVQHVSIDQELVRIENSVAPALARVGLNPDITSNQQLQMKLQFFIAGTLSLYATWLRSDRSQPIETVSDAIEEGILALHDA